ncbi:MAG: histidinol dehydrogenase [Ruminococcus sp.]|jgi:histidinol dehydrogenase|nr:histidinol dehydrogenase [Ruminococcus sp.]
MNIRKIIGDGKTEKDYLSDVRGRGSDTDRQVTAVVSEIIDAVKAGGDKAVNSYTEKFDGKLPKYFEVPREVINDALTDADEKYVNALLNAIENISNFHNRQKEQSMIVPMENGCILGQRVRGLARVGLYVPGGRAAYPSSVLMNAIPAKIAGVGEIVMVTPPLSDGTPNPDILVAAALCGVDRVFLCGGAQAVAALAYGTETIPKCDKIVGPGNIYVATAKKILFGTVDIDMIAGPSEILVVADKNANPSYLAADMLSQAEHDPIASAVLITDSAEIADKTVEELEVQLEKLSRKEIAAKSLENFGAVIVMPDIDSAIALANDFAPEHLELQIDNPLSYIGKIDNAGSVFLGAYTPEALGDYYAGPNHVLPTSGTARFFSPLSVYAFTKRSSFIYYTKEALRDAKDDILTIADKEGLTAHSNSVSIRS